jgi:hypothetical protein
MSTTTHQRLGRLTDSLRRTMRAGRVAATGPDYDAGRTIWNDAVSARPHVIVRCEAQPFGLAYGDPDWIDDVVTRYGLEAPSH